MKKLNPLLTLAGVALALGLGSVNLAAQQPPRGGNFDPQQFQQRIMDFFRDQLAVTNDDEWNVIQPRLSKVVQSRMETLLSGMGMAFGRMGGRGSGGGGNAAGAARRGFPGLGQPGPEAEALQKAIDNNAPTDQIKAALAKYREAQKRKEADLAKAQEELRKLLSLRQEATLVSIGILD
jgi:hypothetical protein